MSHYKIKGNNLTSLVQYYQINDRSNLQSKLSENINIMCTCRVDQSPSKIKIYVWYSTLHIVITDITYSSPQLM